jgi:hypothetical protein
MRNVPFIITTLLFSAALSAQAPFPAKDEINQFSESTTCVVLEEDAFSVFNAYIRDAMKQYWTVTPFEFIDVAEFNTRNTDKNYSFLVLTETNYQKDKTGSVYKFLNLLQGKRVEKLGQMPEICAVPLAYAGEDDIEYGYKLGAILKFMQKHARLIMEDPSKTGRRYLRYYNENNPRAAGKTILAMEEDLSPQVNTLEKIRALYSGKVEIVEEGEIVKAVETGTPGVLILHRVGPAGEAGNSGYCFKMLIGADDADMYYYNMHTIDKANPNGFLPADFKRLGRF